MIIKKQLKIFLNRLTLEEILKEIKKLPLNIDGFKNIENAPKQYKINSLLE